VTYEGHIYNTVQIGDQCWLRENLNVGMMVNGNINQANNDILEKFCYDNNPENCVIYGGLYEWREALQYVTGEGAQGICPAGWHIASDDEWQILEGTIDSQYPVGDPEWDNTGLRGLDAGGKLKETGSTHWDTPNTGATNECGFTGLPGGSQSGSGFFNNINAQGVFWTSSQQNTNSAVDRRLIYNDAAIFRDADSKQNGLSVRCLMGCWPEPTQSNAGPDQVDVPGTSTTLAGNTPTYGTGVWAIENGTGGTIVTPASPASEFQGVVGNEYTLSWTITTQCGSSVDEVVISFASAGFTCGDDLDYEGQSYTTVLIGTQCWMAENLNVGVMINSTSGGFLQTDNDIIERYCYENDITYCDTYGGLYEWPEAMQYMATEGAQGICPSGWHIPTDNEWKILEGTVDSDYGVGDPEWDRTSWRGSDAGGNLKEAGTEHWIDPNEGATNSSGFTGLPAGNRSYLRLGFEMLGYYNFFWTSSQDDAYTAWTRYLYFNSAYSYREPDYKDLGFSVRCIQDQLAP
ncbi:MAG TPA: FISUMP domain-containing protein, partial [Bacteroidales bacterium]|nr:FISUMP domain-containing protein [Bacteroidales bacterium]